MAQMKAKEKEMKDEKEETRKVSRISTSVGTKHPSEPILTRCDLFSLQMKAQAIREKRAKKEEKERYEKLAEKMHRKRVERLKRKEKRNKLLNS